jgi:sodium-dependent dicarboxylate transporter 2/3/5
VITIFPPEFDQLTGLEETKKELAELGPFSKKELKFMIISALMMFVWFTESYLHNVSIATSTTFFATLYFLPGIDLLTYEYVRDKLDWTLIIMIGASCTLGAAMFFSGASGWIAGTILKPFTGASPLVLALVVAILCTLIKILIPSNPACVSILVPTLASFSIETGLPIMVLFLPMAFTVSASWLLPFDQVPLICWSERYFSIRDYASAGIIAHIALILAATAVVVLVGAPLGYF